MQSKKIMLIGSGGCGKTCFVKTCLDEQFEQRYIPTLGVEVNVVTYHQHVLNVWSVKITLLVEI